MHAIALLAATSAALAQPGAVVLRAGEPAPAHAPVRVDAAGVHVGLPGEPPVIVRTIPWDRVRRVDGPLAPGARDYAALAETVWRARVRLERGDPRAAEPLFERADAMLEHAEGATARVVREGLLRCRLARGATAAAIHAWLRLPPLLEGADPAFARAPVVVEPVLGLVPALPPVLPPVSSSRLVLTHSEVSTDRAAVLARWYAAAAAAALGEPADLPDEPAPDAGVALVRDCVLAQAATGEVRDGARERLRDRLANRRGAAQPAWADAWCHAALGRSLLGEPDDDARRLGIVHLLHVPALWGHDQPALAGLCLAEAANALDALGNREGARALAAELRRDFPAHPSLDTLDPALTRPSAPASQDGPPA